MGYGEVNNMIHHKEVIVNYSNSCGANNFAVVCTIISILVVNFPVVKKHIIPMVRLSNLVVRLMFYCRSYNMVCLSWSRYMPITGQGIVKVLP